jgi:uncharacterized protein (TIGR02118 family)
VIRLSVLYPSGEGETFDHDYYRNHHVPMAVKAWSPVRTEIDKGVNGPYLAAVHFVFTDQDALNTAMGTPATAEIIADVANYTTIAPVMQTSEVVSQD